MSDTRIIRLAPMTNARKQAFEAVTQAPDWYTVKIGPETRSDEQNRLLWPLLTEVAKQSKHYGRDLPKEDWKNLFVGALSGAEFVPSLDGKSVMPLGLSTRVLSKAKFSDLIELIYSYSAEHGIVHRGQRVTP
jgi:hypothetical protein